jgi:hypothetical protein
MGELTFLSNTIKGTVVLGFELRALCLYIIIRG